MVDRTVYGLNLSGGGGGGGRGVLQFKLVYCMQFKSFEPHLDSYQSLYDLFAET